MNARCSECGELHEGLCVVCAGCGAVRCEGCATAAPCCAADQDAVDEAAFEADEADAAEGWSEWMPCTVRFANHAAQRTFVGVDWAEGCGPEDSRPEACTTDDEVDWDAVALGHAGGADDE